MLVSILIEQPSIKKYSKLIFKNNYYGREGRSHPSPINEVLENLPKI